MQEKTVVLVDDEPDVVTFLQTALEDHGYLALAASSATAGLLMIKEKKPDLVCLDILMPEESGISLFQKLRTDPELSGIPVVILSGPSLSRDLKHVDFLQLENGTALPAPDGYLEKPADADQFLALVERLVR